MVNLYVILDINVLHLSKTIPTSKGIKLQKLFVITYLRNHTRGKMLTIKRYTIDNNENLLLQISLDTEPSGYFASMSTFLRDEPLITKPWIGEVDRKRNQFKIMRTKRGLLKTRISMTQICGQLTQDKKKIEIKFRLAWYVALTLMWGACCIGFVVYNFFNDFVGWTVFLALVVVQLLFSNLDFRKTEEKFMEYIDHIRSNVAPKV